MNELVVKVHQNSVSKRWWGHYGAGAPYTEHNQTFLEAMALVMTECAEAIEHFRHGLEVNQLVQFSDGDGHLKPDGVPSELADIIIRVLDICGAWDVDIDEAFRLKMAYNATRPERHGEKRA